jgi:CBS-domain-containing membrane protein
VSRADALRAIAALPEALEHTERLVSATARTVADAVTADVPVVSPDTDAENVLAAILASPLRRVAVVDDRATVLGLISDRDISLARALTRARGSSGCWAAPARGVGRHRRLELAAGR